MSEDDELKPCPFCGGGARNDEEFGVWNIVCMRCNTMGPDAKTVEEAIKAWNTRTE